MSLVEQEQTAVTVLTEVLLSGAYDDGGNCLLVDKYKGC